VDDVFRAINSSEKGDTESSRESAMAATKEAVTKASITEMLNSAYDLTIDVDDMFAASAKTGEISKDEMASFLVESK
jgi:hypothetical protein